jgi:hypothetical protein
LIYAQYGLEDPDVELTFFALQLGFTLAIPLFYFQRKATLWREKVEGRKDVPEHKLLWAFFGMFYPRLRAFNVLLKPFSCSGLPVPDLHVLVRMDRPTSHQHVRLLGRACWIRDIWTYQYVVNLATLQDAYLT